jgi:flagellar biosynthetic protein FliP
MTLWWKASATLLTSYTSAMAQTNDVGTLISQVSGVVPSQIVQIFLLLTVLSVAPAILLTMTCFTRLLVAFSFLRTGLGIQSTPANLVLISLSLFMTAAIMWPTFDRSWKEGVTPLIERKISEEQAIEKIYAPFRIFMLNHVRPKDLELFRSMDRSARDDEIDPPFRVLVPAFMISELRRGFEIGLLIILPFLIIDLIVATLIMTMGMMMMPPTVVALPMKLMFFVLIDGWNLLVGSLLRSYG